MKSNKLTTHATVRYFERTDQTITRRELSNHLINGGDIHYVKRMTVTKSMAYIPIKDEVYKIIINRKSKEIITILPFQDVYVRRIKVHSDHYNNREYYIEIYPDCYLETKNKRNLTKITDLKDNKLIAYNHPFFNGLFNCAWKIHLGMKGLENETTKAETTFTLTEEIEQRTNC
jgi:hypothetical protein